MTTLEAVNIILRAARQPTASSLDTGNPSTVGDAEQVLDDVTREIMQEGWNANTDRDVTFTPDGSDEVDFSGESIGVLSVIPVYGSAGLNVSIRSDKLYDVDENRSTFPDNDTIRLDVIRDLSFTAAPYYLQNLIAQTAALRFQQEKSGGRVDDAFIRERAMSARDFARQIDNESAPENLLHEAFAWRVRGDRTAYRRPGI